MKVYSAKDMSYRENPYSKNIHRNAEKIRIFSLRWKKINILIEKRRELLSMSHKFQNR